MAAYVIAELTITDQAGYEANANVALPTIARYGGPVLAASNDVQALEGNWQPKRVVIVEFDSLEQARRWHASREYAEPKRMRRQAATTNAIAVPGLEHR